MLASSYTAPDNSGIGQIQVDISNLNDFDPSTDTVANVALVNTTTTNTDMVSEGLSSVDIRAAVGLTSANLDTQLAAAVTATGFTTPADIANLPTTTEFNARTLPSADYFVVSDYEAPDNLNIGKILEDTDDLQTNQSNWVSADISNLPTKSELDARTLPSASYSQFNYETQEVRASINKINGIAITGNGSNIPFGV
jgi:hypothetical protein